MATRRYAARSTLAAAGLSFAVLIGGCGSDAVDPSEEIATLETVIHDTEETVVTANSAAEVSPADSALAFSECMRDEGNSDFPDLRLDASGNIDIAAAVGQVDINDPSIRDAFDVCKPVIASGGFGGQVTDGLQSPEFQQALLDFSDCVRAEDIDAGDLSLSELINGVGARNLEAGSSEAGFGDRTAIYAKALGIDGEDPDVQAAIKNCQNIIDQATADVGL